MHKARWEQKCAICREPIARQEAYRLSEVGIVHDRCGLARPVNADRRRAYGRRKAQQRRAKAAGRG